MRVKTLLAMMDLQETKNVQAANVPALRVAPSSPSQRDYGGH